MLNVTKTTIAFLLLCLACLDLAITVSVRDDVQIFPVQYVSIGMKIATFVSRDAYQ